MFIGNIVKNKEKQQVFANYDINVSANDFKLPYAENNNTILGGDTRCEYFLPDTTDAQNNWIQITSEEGNYKIVEGSFRLKMIKTQDCPDRDYPDTVNITDGYFKLHLEQ